MTLPITSQFSRMAQCFVVPNATIQAVNGPKYLLHPVVKVLILMPPTIVQIRKTVDDRKLLKLQ